MRLTSKAILTLPLVLAACGGAAPSMPSPAAAAASAPSSPVAAAASDSAPAAPQSGADATPTTSSSAPAPAAATPEFEVTPPAQLKALKKADILAARKTVKGGDAWDAALKKLETKLGPPTYVSHEADKTKPWKDVYIWSAIEKDGSCEQLSIQVSSDGANLLDLATETVKKDDSTLPETGGKPVNTCTGAPR